MPDPDDRKPPTMPQAAVESPYVRAFLDLCIQIRRRQLYGDAPQEQEQER